jgi:glyoxylase-like metal-dependent hydrolase (beta-lactamase superfamily II)
VGTARTDFPGGSSVELYNSIQKLYKLLDETKLYVGHDYPKDTSKPVIETTIGEQKRRNILLNEKTTLEEFVEKREARQKSLPVPTLLFPALFVNLMAGRVPKFIKIPVNMI